MAEGHSGPIKVGGYGPWAASIVGDAPPEFSFRNSDWQDLKKWKLRVLDSIDGQAGYAGYCRVPTSGGRFPLHF